MALLSSLSPGDIFLLNENGVPAEFYVGVHDYQSDLNGTGRTLCVRKDVCTEQMAWSNMATFFSGTYLPTLDPAIQSAVGTTKFYVNAGSGAIGTITEERAIFALSGTELGFSSSSLTVEGTALPVAEQIRVAGPDGYVPQFTRSPDTDGMGNVFAVTAAGGLQSISESAQGYARPAFTLPATTEVSVPIPAPAITAPPNVSWGVPATATCTTVEDPNGGTVSYSWGLSYDGTSWKTLSGSSNRCTYTAFGDHYLRVKAVSSIGVASRYSEPVEVTAVDKSIRGRGVGGYPWYDPQEWELLVPQNIRQGVTIVSPSGERIEGTYADLKGCIGYYCRTGASESSVMDKERLSSIAFDESTGTITVVTQLVAAMLSCSISSGTAFSAHAAGSEVAVREQGSYHVGELCVTSDGTAACTIEIQIEMQQGAENDFCIAIMEGAL